MFKLGRLFDDLAIDLGTSNTLIFSDGEIIVNEPTVIAVQESKGSRKLAAAGQEAKLIIGKESNRIKAIRPVMEGIIVDVELATLMLRHFIRKARKRSFGIRRRVVATMQTEIAQVESRALRTAIESAGADEVYLMEGPLAAAIGAGLPVNEPAGAMIVDVGGGITEAAVISLSGIVCSKTIPVAGNHMDAAIIQHMKKEYGLLIGERSGEAIKIAFGNTYLNRDIKTLKVKGMDLRSRMPGGREITLQEMRDVIMPSIELIATAVKDVFGLCPPELSSDIVSHGIMLSGGCAILKNIEMLLIEITGLPVTISKDPFLNVVCGAGMTLDHMEALRKAAN